VRRSRDPCPGTPALLHTDAGRFTAGDKALFVGGLVADNAIGGMLAGSNVADIYDGAIVE